MPKVELTVAAAFESSDAVSGFEDIASAADDMASTVSDAGDSVSDAADQMGDVSATAKDVTSNAKLASSSLSGLAGGLDAVGATGAADKLREVQTVTSTLGATGKAVVLVMKSQAVQSAATKAAMVAQAVATKAVSAATKAYSVVQWALNAALSANPIGLIIVLIAAMVAGIILAYKKSDTFREIVDKAFSVAKAGVTKLVEVVKDVPGFIGKIIDKVGFLAPAFSVAKELIVGYIDLITKPLQLAYELIKKIASAASHLHIPHIPGTRIGAAGRTTAGGTDALGPVGLGKGGLIVPVTVQGGYVGNEVGLARVISAAVSAELRRRGIRP